ncbi:MAG: zonular occludens toxin domain-containing protein [Verrucomicrobiota bacterium]
MPLHLDRIQEYADKREWGIDVEDRIVLLDDQYLQLVHENGRNRNQALSQFFRFRMHGKFMPMWEPGDILDWSELYQDADGVETGYKGTIYILDEIHKLWPSRAYAKADTRVFEYLAEHRHLGDEVIFITQHLAQVDKQIRLLGQDFEVMRNRGKEKYAWFAGPKVFRRSVYLRPPTGSTMDQPAEVTTFRLNPEQANCYETSAQGGEADKGQTAKGIPYPFLWGGLIAAGLGVWFLAVKLPAIIIGTTEIDDQLTSEQAGADPEAENHLLPISEPSTSTDQPPAPTEPVYWVAMSRFGDQVEVYLSNGRKYTDQHPDLHRVNFLHETVVISGETIYRKPREVSRSFKSEDDRLD